MTIDDLKKVRKNYFDFLHVTEEQYERMLKAGPPKMRVGSRSIEMEVRHFMGDPEWQPLNMNVNRSNAKDFSPDASAAGGKHSKK